MSTRDIVIGIDTSNYTTSVALMSMDGELIANIKHLLPVELGQCGLRQSDALFAMNLYMASITQTMSVKELEQ